MAVMRMYYDREADAAYLDCVPAGMTIERHEGDVLDFEATGASIMVDLDRDRRILAVEFLGASKLLHPETLARLPDPSSSKPFA